MRNSTSIKEGPSEVLSGAKEVGKALSDLNRLRILGALRGRELCVCHLVEMLEVDASNVSRHVALLRRAGLISVRRDGRWSHCSRAKQEGATGKAFWSVVDGLLEGAVELERDRQVVDGLLGC